MEEDEHEDDQGPVDRTRSEYDDEEAWKKSEAEQKAQYERRLKFMMDEDEKKAKMMEKSRRGRKDELRVGDAVDGEPTEGEAVGVTKVRVKEQPSSKPSPKTQRKPRVKGLEEDISPIVQKMVDDEIERRLNAKQSLTRRLFQEEFDEEDAKTSVRRKYEEVKRSIRENGQNQSRKRGNQEKTVRIQDEGRTGKEETR